MSQAALSAATVSVEAGASPPPGTRLRRRWLLLARICWVAVAGLALAIFIISLPAAFAQGETVCRSAACASDQLTPAAVQNLHAADLSLDFFAWYIVVLKCLFTCAFTAVGVIIFWRTSADRTALVAAFAFLTFPITFTQVPSALQGFWWLPAQAMDFLGSIGMSLLFFVFPNGRFVPRWTRWLWAVSQVGYIAKVFFPSAPIILLLGQVPLLGLVISLVAAQIYRYRRVSTPVERQQTKWVVLGVSVGFIGFLITVGLYITVPNFSGDYTLLYLISSGLTFLCPILIPLSFGVALARYRLWDVDVLIGKVLVYGLLTGLLGVLYAGLIIGLESLVRLFTGQVSNNPAVLVISTLAIAALFQPARKRLQELIDRRFYRKKLDAAETLAAFTAALRQETNLEQLRAQLLAVVHETMQPARVSLWLRSPEERPAHRETRL